MINDDHDPTEFDLGDDLEITKTTRQAAADGTWVIGTIAGHRFNALVFAEHAEHSDAELGNSRISKLLLRRIADGLEVFSWDRGLDRAAADETVRAIVDFLAAGLADHVFAG
ncbi:MAG TPA: hypothetical protein VG826_11860 [Pirellulales bacterium]|nr:hypothetical protein [Pirellulales bacterium]